MTTNQMMGVYEMEGVKRIEISAKRVAVWTLVFTNAFFLSYFCVRLVQVIG
jgi:hypothetical protein